MINIFIFSQSAGTQHKRNGRDIHGYNTGVHSGQDIPITTMSQRKRLPERKTRINETGDSNATTPSKGIANWCGNLFFSGVHPPGLHANLRLGKAIRQFEAADESMRNHDANKEIRGESARKNRSNIQPVPVHKSVNLLT